MKLSVIIVNYNVAYFLEQCLLSLFNASKKCTIEVFVIDNNSVDDSIEMIKKKFPQVILIENKDNKGFSKANNQGIKLSSGEYVLLLNPDTVVQEDTFEKVISFMDITPAAGGLGVKMIDGKGKFLPESKRGLPTPLVAFYKIFGLSALFPKSKIFNKYHLGYLSENKINEIEILSGAFMFLRKKALDKSGLLDEAFFMYGEDIDLSYRITKSGFKNYYFPLTEIIHYKGESTKKSSANYVFVFYNAMIIFAKKHFSSGNAKTFSVLINLAIYFRAALAVMARFIKKIALPVFDFVFVLIGLYLIKIIYVNFTGISIQPFLVNKLFPAFSIIWLLTIYFFGGYDKPVNVFKILRGNFIGTILILIFYSVLPENWRFSRAIILFGAAYSTLALVGSRFIFQFFNIKEFGISTNIQKNYIVIGWPDETSRVSEILKQTSTNIGEIFLLNSKDEVSSEQKNRLDKLKQMVEVFKVTEIIFCSKDISSGEIINIMGLLDSKNVDFKIAPPESIYMIGSNSVEKSGEVFVLDVNSINKQSNKRDKKVADVFLSFLFVIVSPVLIWFVENKIGFIKNIFSVIIGEKSWVGYSKTNQSEQLNLPKIKDGVLSHVDLLSKKQIQLETINKLNILYAKDYSLKNDFLIVLRSIKKLGS
jgi:O-antigen biosynthesis protein